MAEGDAEEVVLGALARGLPAALIEARAPFAVRWANVAFVRLLGRDEPVEGLPFLALLGCPDRGLAAMFEGLGASGTSVVVGSGEGPRPREHELILLPAAEEAAVLVLVRDITDREASHRRLEAENLHLALLANVTRELSSLDANRVVDAAVGAACSIVNGPAAIYLVGAAGDVTRRATAGMSAALTDVLPFSVPPGHFAALTRALESGQRQTLPYAVNLPREERDALRESGARWLTVTPIRGRQGIVGAVVILWRQRTPGDMLSVIDLVAGHLGIALEHARAYRAAEDERTQLELILAQIPDAVLISDAAGRLERTNAAGRRLLGLGPNDPLPSLDALPIRIAWTDPEGRPSGSYEGQLARALRGEAMTGRVAHLSAADSGVSRWLQSAAAPLRNPAGTIIGMVGVLTDITEVTQAQRRLQLLVEASGALASSLDSTNALAEIAHLAVQSFADWCAIDLIEDGAVRRLPVAHADPAKAALARELERLGPHAATVVLAAEPAIYDDVGCMQLVGAAQRAGDPAFAEALALRSCITAPMIARGQRLGVMHLASAESARRYEGADLAVAEVLAWRAALAIDRARLYEDAREANRRKDEFLAVVSHELRTPLAPLLTWAEILRRQPDAAHARQAASVIERNIHLLRGLITELLDLASITGGKLHLDRAAHDLSDVVRDTATDMAPLVEDKGISLDLRPAREPLPVEIDRGRVVQIITNLVSNAVKFTPRGGTITVSTAQEGDQARLAVRDTGAGISPDFLPHVFEMFRQGEEGSRRVHGGLGIGLALARQITELHGGDIEARSEGTGRGAEFIVRLPLREPEVAVRDGWPAHEVPPAALDDTRVLLVEDVPDSREAMREVLEQFGADVVPAHDGRDALEKLATANPDLVLCDLRMPVMDGYEFVRHVRADPTRSGLPVVAVSGFGSEESRSACRDAGFDAYLAKPVDSSALVTSIRNALRARRKAS